jgi:hypothetical protein
MGVCVVELSAFSRQLSAFVNRLSDSLPRLTPGKRRVFEDVKEIHSIPSFPPKQESSLFPWIPASTGMTMIVGGVTDS